LTLELLNGGSPGYQVYEVYSLDADGPTLPAGGYLVIGSEDTVLSGLGPDVLMIPLGLGSVIQNGSPDGVRILGPDGEFIDGLAYEGEMVGVGEGTSPSYWDGSVDGVSLCRMPNGTDTNDNEADFTECVSTPGATNLALP
ncbi:MAG: hypothetical protein V3S37_07310, partial [Dehalococcoidia bacterium]